jgi:glutathione S-transferase
MMDKVEEAFSILDTYLEGHDWVAGDQITIADYSIVATVSTVEVL